MVLYDFCAGLLQGLCVGRSGGAALIWREGKVAGLRKRELLDWGRGEGTVVFLECLNTQILMAEHVEGFT